MVLRPILLLQTNNLAFLPFLWGELVECARQ